MLGDFLLIVVVVGARATGKGDDKESRSYWRGLQGATRKLGDDDVTSLLCHGFRPAPAGQPTHTTNWTNTPQKAHQIKPRISNSLAAFLLQHGGIITEQLSMAIGSFSHSSPHAAFY
jgi:hypothetical protein